MHRLAPLASLAEWQDVARYYLRFYREYALDKWNHITPMQYGILLISIAVTGWLLMKNMSR